MTDAADRIDREALLAPVSVAAPAGENLRYSGLYDAIAEARREDEQAASQGIWTSDAKRADWGRVLSLSAEALATRSKDLQLACWLAEALYQRAGLAGLAEALRLITALCERFWHGLYPELEGEDAEARLAPLLALETRLVRQLAQLPLTEPDRESGVAYALQHWIAAQRLEPLSSSNPRAYRQALDNGELPLGRLRDAAARTPVAFYQDLLARQQACSAATAELRTLLEMSCGREAPSFSRLLGALADIQRMVGVLAAGRLAPAPQLAALATEAADPAPGARAADLSVPGRIDGRQQAYRQLDEAADYLLATEPHSPVPYLVKRAIRWGSMPLGSLLAELVDEDERLKRILALLNIADAPRR